MIDYAFPAELAEQVVSRWRTFVSRHDSPAPPLPPPPALQHVIETAFFASFVREEGRDLRFVLCCSTDLAIRRDGVAEIVPVRISCGSGKSNSDERIPLARGARAPPRRRYA